ncbi:Sodium/hydrogen exchanger 7 [Linum grandiflorum]
MAGGSIIGDEQETGFSIIPQRSSTSSSLSSPIDAVIFFGFSLLLGIASRRFSIRIRLPYTVTLLIIGTVIGYLEYGTALDLGNFGHGIRVWGAIDPDLLLAVFLPVLIFDSAFSMEPAHIKGCMVQILLLAVPGVLISTVCLGSALKLTFPYNWSWKISLLLGGLLSATDPVAVLALLKELGGSKKLSTIIEGESMMNDGIAIVVYQLFLKMVLQTSFSVGIGLCFGVASVSGLAFISSDTAMEMALTLGVSYVAYFTAQVGADVSGILTVMSLGMFCAIAAKIAFNGDGLKGLHNFWELVAYIANTVVFILSGVLIAESVLQRDHTFHSHGISWGYLLLLYIFVQVSRFVVVLALYPLLWYFGTGLDWKEATIITWSGLRGPVALALALSFKHCCCVHQRTSDSSSYISPETGIQFIFFTGGIVFLTLVVNGSTTQLFLYFLDMVSLTDTKRTLLEHTKHAAMDKALEAFGKLGDDIELGQIYWATVKDYITIFKKNNGENVQTHSTSDAYIDPNTTNLKEIRAFLLNGVRSAYLEMLEMGMIVQATANILIKSADEAKDLAAHEPLCDWKVLETSVHFPSYYKVLQAKFWPEKLVTCIAVLMLGPACYISAAFLRAHRVAQQKLLDRFGDSDAASTVINESDAEGEDAREFLEKVRVTFPQVLYVVNMRQVTNSVLSHLMDYLKNVEKAGLLEETEIVHLQDAVQSDLKRLVRNPPLVEIPKITAIINSHPLSGSLSSPIREQIAASSTEIMKPPGVPLYEQGSNSNGVWFICNGVVKKTSESLRTRCSDHATFVHGSTLGLYEVLAGKPYICNMITDTTTQSFFVESEKMLSARRASPVVEDFLWQESAIVLAKLLLPQIYRRMGVRDLRAVFAERSMMSIYSSGESIRIPHPSVAILLEGSIKPDHGLGELISSPATLLSPDGNSQGSKVVSCWMQYEVVEARTRVIILDTREHKADRAMERGSSSSSSSLVSLYPGYVPHAIQQNEVMRWRDRSHVRGVNRLAIRAMQLSIFGTLVDDSVHNNEVWSDGTAAVAMQDEEADLIGPATDAEIRLQHVC